MSAISVFRGLDRDIGFPFLESSSRAEKIKCPAPISSNGVIYGSSPSYRLRMPTNLNRVLLSIGSDNLSNSPEPIMPTFLDSMSVIEGRVGY